MQWIVGRGRSFDDDIRRLDFKRLLCAFRHDENAFDAQRRTDVLACDFVVVSKFFTLENNLNVLEKAAVVQFDKSKVFTVADGTRPAADCHRLSVKGRKIGIKAFDLCCVHKNFLVVFRSLSARYSR